MIPSRSRWMMTVWLLISVVPDGVQRSQELQEATTAAEVTSLLGKPLSRPRLEPDRLTALRKELEQAELRLRQDPEKRG